MKDLNEQVNGMRALIREGRVQLGGGTIKFGNKAIRSDGRKFTKPKIDKAARRKAAKAARRGR